MGVTFNQLGIGDKVYIYRGQNSLDVYTIKNKTYVNDHFTLTLENTTYTIMLSDRFYTSSQIGSCYADREKLLEHMYVNLKILKNTIKKYLKLNDMRNMARHTLIARDLYCKIQYINGSKNIWQT